MTWMQISQTLKLCFYSQKIREMYVCAHLCIYAYSQTYGWSDAKNFGSWIYLFFWGGRGRIELQISFVIRLTFIKRINTDFHAFPASHEQFPSNAAVVSIVGTTGFLKAKLQYFFLWRKTAVIFVSYSKIPPPLLLFFSFYFFFFFTEITWTEVERFNK